MNDEASVDEVIAILGWLVTTSISSVPWLSPHITKLLLLTGRPCLERWKTVEIEARRQGAEKENNALLYLRLAVFSVTMKRRTLCCSVRLSTCDRQ